jgi:hypothetical protein
MQQVVKRIVDEVIAKLTEPQRHRNGELAPCLPLT